VGFGWCLGWVCLRLFGAWVDGGEVRRECVVWSVSWAGFRQGSGVLGGAVAVWGWGGVCGVGGGVGGGVGRVVLGVLGEVEVALGDKGLGLRCVGVVVGAGGYVG